MGKNVDSYHLLLHFLIFQSCLYIYPHQIRSCYSFLVYVSTLFFTQTAPYMYNVRNLSSTFRLSEENFVLYQMHFLTF